LVVEPDEISERVVGGGIPDLLEGEEFRFAGGGDGDREGEGEEDGGEFHGVPWVKLWDHFVESFAVIAAVNVKRAV
jgi:hypothetical protein